MTTANLLDLDELPSLGELLDPVPLLDLCTSFASIHGLGLQLFDAQGSKLVDLPSTKAFQDAVARDPVGLRRLSETAMRLEQATLRGDEILAIEGYAGLRSLVGALLFQGEVVGRVILGSFREGALPPGSLELELELELERLDPEEAQALWEQVPVSEEGRAAAILRHFRTAMEVLIVSAYRVHWTSRLHMESLRESHRELSAKAAELEKSYEQLQQLDALKSSFLATVSHELRTPLTSIIGYAEILADQLAGPLSPAQRGHLQTIMEKGEGLLDLVNSLLDLTRIEAGRLRIEVQECKVGDLLADALSSIHPQLMKRGIHIRVEAHPDVQTVAIDKEKVQRCLVNLLANAVKFTSRGGSIALRADVAEAPPSGAHGRFDGPEDYFRLVVEDTGIGIPPEALDRIFDTFFQVDGSSTRSYGGSGLGLAIVRNCVEAHGGAIGVESTPGVGSKFTLVLPRRYVPPPRSKQGPHRFAS